MNRRQSPRQSTGYSLHITREPDATPPWVEESTWRAVAASRVDLRYADSITATNPITGHEIRIEGPFWFWTGHRSGHEVALRYGRGRISVDKPDEATVDFLVALAEQLDAFVQGDEGERYPMSWPE